MPDRFESWKNRPPASPKEGIVADLLKQVGEAETLSPQAMQRIERSLRQVRARPFWLGSLGLATAAVGGLAVALVVMVTVRQASSPAGSTASTPTSASASAAARAKRAEQTLALNDRPAPPEAAPAEAQPTAPAEAKPAQPSEPKSRRERPADEFVSPPPAWTGKLAEKEAKRPAALDRGLGQAERSADSLAKRSVESSAESFDRSEGLASPTNHLDVAGAAGAPAAAPQEARQLKAAAPSEESSLECQDEIARASAVLAASSGDLEHALYIRGTCRLQLGLRESGIQDFQDYLRRFPNGRFAPAVRARLAHLHAH